MRLSELHATMVELKREQAPGSEPSWWGDYGEDIRKHCGILPWGDYEDDVEVPTYVATWWLAGGVDWSDVAQDSKSHTAEELCEGFLAGKKFFLLDSTTSGNDDILLGENEEDVREDLLDWLQTREPPVEEIPNDWALSHLGAEELLERYPIDPI